MPVQRLHLPLPLASQHLPLPPLLAGTGGGLRSLLLHLGASMSPQCDSWGAGTGAARCGTPAPVQHCSVAEMSMCRLACRTGLRSNARAVGCGLAPTRILVSAPGQHSMNCTASTIHNGTPPITRNNGAGSPRRCRDVPATSLRPAWRGQDHPGPLPITRGMPGRH